MGIRTHKILTTLKRAVIYFLILFAVLTILVAWRNKQLRNQPYGTLKLPFMRDTLTLLVAQNPYQWRRGLSGFDSLPSGYDGMLFIFPEEKVQKFWMYKVKFPLSIYFIDHTGKITASYLCVPPCNSPPCEVYQGKALFVLELPCKRAFTSKEIRRVKEWRLHGY